MMEKIDFKASQLRRRPLKLLKPEHALVFIFRQFHGVHGNNVRKLCVINNDPFKTTPIIMFNKMCASFYNTSWKHNFITRWRDKRKVQWAFGQCENDLFGFCVDGCDKIHSIWWDCKSTDGLISELNQNDKYSLRIG